VDLLAVQQPHHAGDLLGEQPSGQREHRHGVDADEAGHGVSSHEVGVSAR